MQFKDRLDAAARLMPFLKKYQNQKGVVLAVPRGGVPIAYHIAKNLNLPLELVLIKKIGHPMNEEYAIGAVGLEGEVLDDFTDIPKAYIESEVVRIRALLQERYKKFMGNRKPLSLENKTVIIVDDGIATGNTMLAAIRMMRYQRPGKIVVAVPVAPPQTAEKIKREVDELVCLYSPPDFGGVGQFYDDFEQVSDEEVIGLLQEIYKIQTAA